MAVVWAARVFFPQGVTSKRGVGLLDGLISLFGPGGGMWSVWRSSDPQPIEEMSGRRVKM
jgi:hypothetical protein